MCRWIIIMALALMSTSAFAQTGEVRVGVKGMVCAFCAQGIEKKFKAQKEVDQIKVSLENKLIVLKFKDGQSLTNEKMAELLKEAGYEAIFNP